MQKMRWMVGALLAMIVTGSFGQTATTAANRRDVAGATFAALSANGSTPAYDSNTVVNNHTVTVIPTGAPTGCTLTLEGSVDGTNWYTLVTGVTCTTAVTGFVADRPARFMRGTLSALAGGTSPTVTVKYLGAR